MDPIIDDLAVYPDPPPGFEHQPTFAWTQSELGEIKEQLCILNDTLKEMTRLMRALAEK